MLGQLERSVQSGDKLKNLTTFKLLLTLHVPLQGGSRLLVTGDLRFTRVQDNSCFAVAFYALHKYAQWAREKANEKKNKPTRSRRKAKADYLKEELDNVVKNSNEDNVKDAAIEFLQTYLPGYDRTRKVTIDEARTIASDYHARENNRLFMFDER